MLARVKEKLIFGAAVVALAAVAVLVFWPAPLGAEPPDDPRVAPPKSAGAVLGVGSLYSTGRLDDYWKDADHYVFVQPPPVHVFKPVPLEVPAAVPPRPPLPLTAPGPFVQNTEGLPRLGDSATLSAPPPPAPVPPAAAPPTPPAPPTPAPGPKPAPGGNK